MERGKYIVQIGPHTLILGDAYSFLPNLCRFDALVMDPPYVVATSGGGRFKKDRPHTDEIRRRGMDKGFDLSILSWKYADAIVCFCSDDQVDKVKARLRQGFHRQCLCTWAKSNPMPVANKHYRPDSEFYVHAWQKGYSPTGDLDQKSRYILGLGGKSKFDHPTVKPDYVMNKIMANVSGETVCDPMMGTGSTGVAAAKAGKVFTGIEIDEHAFKIACERMADTLALAAKGSL